MIQDKRVNEQSMEFESPIQMFNRKEDQYKKIIQHRKALSTQIWQVNNKTPERKFANQYIDNNSVEKLKQSIVDSSNRLYNHSKTRAEKIEKTRQELYTQRIRQEE